ncbi:MAG TPA: type II toxin-antitoxin system RelE/ParE family toxin [Pyrinomonadaceae bacterium]
MIRVEWCAPAFAQLEMLDQKLAFEIVERVDILVTFPESGAPLESRQRSLRGCRQLIVGRHTRVVYEYDSEAGEVWVLAIQHCRQRLPSARELKRRRREEQESR